MRAIDIFGLAAAVVIALLSLVVEPWSKPWWGALILAAVIACAAASNMLIDSLSSLNRRKLALSAWGPWLLIVGGPLLGILWLYLPTGAISSDNSTAALARLADLGWTVKPGPRGIQFEIVSGPLPSMKESAAYLIRLNKPFNLRFQQVSGLDGLHYLSEVPGCTKIEINAGEFTDISELRGFKNLTNLGISQLPLNGNGVVDLSPLISLTNLTQLNLGMVRARTIDPLASLKNLKALNLGQTLIADISPLASLNLRSLEIRGTRVTDLSPLSNHTDLEELTIGGAQVAGLAKLSNLPNLKKISIIDQQGIDLSAISHLNNLESLWIWAGSAPLDVLPLQGLTNLRTLTLTGVGFGQDSPLYNVQVISNLKDLRTLTLGYFQVSDLTFIENLKNLNEINLNRLPVSSIASLSKLLSLKKISLVDIPVVDISPLLQLPLLTDLALLRTPARSDVLTELERRGVTVKR